MNNILRASIFTLGLICLCSLISYAGDNAYMSKDALIKEVSIPVKENNSLSSYQRLKQKYNDLRIEDNGLREELRQLKDKPEQEPATLIVEQKEEVVRWDAVIFSFFAGFIVNGMIK